GVWIGFVEPQIIQRRIINQLWIRFAKDVVFSGVMKIPTELLGNYFYLIRPRGSCVQLKRRPNSLAHHGQADEDHRSHDGPDYFKAIVSVAVSRPLLVGCLAIFPA